MTDYYKEKVGGPYLAINALANYYGICILADVDLLDDADHIFSL